MTSRRAVLPALVCAAFLLAMASAVGQGDNATAPGNTTAPGGGGAPAGNGTAPADNASSPSGGGGGALDYAVVVFPVEKEGAFSWNPKELTFPAGAKVQLTYDGTKAIAPHNINVYEGLPEPVATDCCLVQITGKSSIQFTMPESGTLKFKCDAHEEMQGVINVGAFTTGGAAGAAHGIEHVGVHYLAYWVAVIAFAVLFIIYGLTFFLFKHGESNATTDHMDRPGAASGDASGNRLRTLTVALVTVVLVVGGLVLAFVNMPAAG